MVPDTVGLPELQVKSLMARWSPFPAQLGQYLIMFVVWVFSLSWHPILDDLATFDTDLAAEYGFKRLGKPSSPQGAAR